MPQDWRGHLHRFKTKRDRDHWVTAAPGRQAVYHGHFTFNFAAYMSRTRQNIRWEVCADGSEAFRMDKNPYWPS